MYTISLKLFYSHQKCCVYNIGLIFPLFRLVSVLVAAHRQMLSVPKFEGQVWAVPSTHFRPWPHQDWGRTGTAGSCFARDGKGPGGAAGEYTIIGRTAT